MYEYRSKYSRSVVSDFNKFFSCQQRSFEPVFGTLPIPWCIKEN